MASRASRAPHPLPSRPSVSALPCVAPSSPFSLPQPSCISRTWPLSPTRAIQEHWHHLHLSAVADIVAALASLSAARPEGRWPPEDGSTSALIPAPEADRTARRDAASRRLR